MGTTTLVASGNSVGSDRRRNPHAEHIVAQCGACLDVHACSRCPQHACIADDSPHELEQLIRASGYFRQKAARLKQFIAFVDCKYGGSLDAMLACSTNNLRADLLALKGIGPETADSILLYAGQHPIFVVDAYTRRVLERHEAVTPSAGYDAIRELVECALRDEECLTGTACRDSPQVHSPSPMSTARREPRAQVYNEMHGLFVQLGEHYCTKKQPNCELCPLGTMLPRLVTASEQAKSQKTKSNPRRRASKKMARAAV